jgi:hypothetical protein
MADKATSSYPSLIPNRKPTDRPLSAATQRMFDVWAPHEDRGNPLYSNFKYSALEGFEESPTLSRRDPSKVLLIDGTYYVWYTHRDTPRPVGPANANDELPSFDWDMCDVWYATSKDGFVWEEQGPAVQRPPKGEYGWRSNCTPDILAWKGRYYLYYQAYNQIIMGGDTCPVTVAEADSPDGPWTPVGRTVVPLGEPGAWDDACIHDPFPLVYKGRIWLYYKGQNAGAKGQMSMDHMTRMQGVAIADDPLGPFEKPAENPLLNSGHETCLWPYEEGIAAIVSLDGPEKNTVQFAPDGINFEMKSLLQVPPVAPGPFVPDAFADNSDGRGITWGLCHVNTDHGSRTNSILVRFDCDLSKDVDRPEFKRNNLRFTRDTYLKGPCALPDDWRERIKAEGADRETVRG